MMRGPFEMGTRPAMTAGGLLRWPTSRCRAFRLSAVGDLALRRPVNFAGSHRLGFHDLPARGIHRRAGRSRGFWCPRARSESGSRCARFCLSVGLVCLSRGWVPSHLTPSGADARPPPVRQVPRSHVRQAQKGVRQARKGDRQVSVCPHIRAGRHAKSGPKRTCPAGLDSAHRAILAPEESLPAADCKEIHRHGAKARRTLS